MMESKSITNRKGTDGIRRGRNKENQNALKKTEIIVCFGELRWGSSTCLPWVWVSMSWGRGTQPGYFQPPEPSDLCGTQTTNISTNLYLFCSSWRTHPKQSPKLKVHAYKFFIFLCCLVTRICVRRNSYWRKRPSKMNRNYRFAPLIR
jgi:hypothetical protein